MDSKMDMILKSLLRTSGLSLLLIWPFILVLQVWPKFLLLKVWPWDQKHFYYLGAYKKCTMSGSTLALLEPDSPFQQDPQRVHRLRNNWKVLNYPIPIWPSCSISPVNQPRCSHYWERSGSQKGCVIVHGQYSVPFTEQWWNGWMRFHVYFA